MDTQKDHEEDDYGPIIIGEMYELRMEENSITLIRLDDKYFHIFEGERMTQPMLMLKLIIELKEKFGEKGGDFVHKLGIVWCKAFDDRMLSVH